jgi:hypothetical protein
MALTIDIQPELEERLQEEAGKIGIDKSRFVLNTLEERLQRPPRKGKTPPCLPDAEAKLLQEINKGLPEEVWQRYSALIAMLRAETITPEEQDELTGLSDQIEIANAHRIGLVAQLADLRNVPLNVMMKQLGIKPRNV